MRTALSAIAVLALTGIAGCDSASEEEDPIDILVDWCSMTAISEASLPAYVPGTYDRELLSEGNLAVREDHSWTMHLFGSTVQYDEDVPWEITWSGSFSVTGRAAILTIEECAETGAARTCADPSVVGVVLKGKNWTTERLILDMQSDDDWVFEFGREVVTQATSRREWEPSNS
jgi:hypothetical protein